MKFCPQCRCELPDAKDFAVAGTSNEEAADDVAWSPVARLANLAEVGYFADTLEGAGIATNVLQHHEFSALDGRWDTVFVLRVSTQEAQRAAQLMREELAHYGEEPEPGGDDWPAEQLEKQAAPRGNLWTPVMLMLVAGGIAYFAGRGSLTRPAPPSSPEALMEALTETDRPISMEGPAGQVGGTRRLRYIPRTRTILLEEDRDGDGRWDRRQQFLVPPKP